MSLESKAIAHANAEKPQFLSFRLSYHIHSPIWPPAVPWHQIHSTQSLSVPIPKFQREDLGWLGLTRISLNRTLSARPCHAPQFSLWIKCSGVPIFVRIRCVPGSISWIQNTARFLWKRLEKRHAVTENSSMVTRGGFLN